MPTFICRKYIKSEAASEQLLLNRSARSCDVTLSYVFGEYEQNCYNKKRYKNNNAVIGEIRFEMLEEVRKI